MNKMTGQGCPSNKLQGAIGQFYENTNNGDIYECQSILKDCNGVSCCNWVLRASGEHIDDHAEIFGSGGGSGLPTGGTAHQQLVTDKDGNAVWEEKLCYKEDGRAEIAPETQFDNTNEGRYVMLSEGLVEGEEYIVVWNGTEYSCIATLNNELNHLMLGGENNGYPFWLDYFDESNKLWINTSDTAVTIAIYKNGSAVKKIDPEYLPDSAGAGMMIVTFTPVNEYFEDATADKTVAELFEAYDNGSAIFAMINMGEMGNNILLPLTEIVHPEYMAFDVEKDMGGRMAFHAEIFPEGAMVRQKDTSPVTTVYVVTDTSKKGYVYAYDDFDYVVNGYLNGGNMPVALFYRNVNGNAHEEIYANMTSLKKDSKNNAIQIIFTAIVDGTTLVTLTYNKDSANPNEVIYEERDIGGSAT